MCWWCFKILVKNQFLFHVHERHSNAKWTSRIFYYRVANVVNYFCIKATADDKAHCRTMQIKNVNSCTCDVVLQSWLEWFPQKAITFLGHNLDSKFLTGHLDSRSPACRYVKTQTHTNIPPKLVGKILESCSPGNVAAILKR